MKNNKLLLSLVISGGMVSTGFAINMNMHWVPTPPSIPQVVPNVNYAGGTPCFDEKKGKYIKGYVRNHIRAMKNTLGQQMSGYRQQVHQLRNQFKQTFRQQRQTMKQQLLEAYDKLPTDVKEKLRKVREDYISQIKQLRQKFRIANQEERQQILQQIQDLREKLHSQIQQVVAWTDYAKLLQQKWEQVDKLRQQKQEQIQAVKQNIQQIRAQFRQARAELIAKYKTVIYQKFKNKIDNMSLAKLQKVKEKIEKAKQRFEKLPLKPKTKEKIMSVLAALDEMITERIAKLQQQEQSINTDDLLNNLLGE